MNRNTRTNLALFCLFNVFASFCGAFYMGLNEVGNVLWMVITMSISGMLAVVVMPEPEKTIPKLRTSPYSRL